MIILERGSTPVRPNQPTAITALLPVTSIRAGSKSTTAFDGLGQLRKLPVELRIEVYRYALVPPGPVFITGCRRTQAMRKNDTHFAGSNSATRSVRAKVAVTQGRRQCRPRISKIMPFGLLRASAAIESEAASIFHGSSHFNFSSAQVCADFLEMIPRYVPHLTYIICANAGTSTDAYHLRHLVRMLKPKVVGLRATSRGMSRRTYTKADDCVRLTWEQARSFVARKRVDGERVHKFTGERLMERLEAFHFDVPRSFLFEDRAIDHDAERNERFRQMMKEYVRGVAQ